MVVNPKSYGAMLKPSNWRRASPRGASKKSVSSSSSALLDQHSCGRLTVRNGYVRVVRPSAFAVGRGCFWQDRRITWAMSDKIDRAAGLPGPAYFQTPFKCPSKPLQKHPQSKSRTWLTTGRKRTTKKKSPRRQFSEFSMENCTMREPRLEVSLWGFRISAVGALAVCAAVLIFFAALAAWRF